MSQDRWAEVDAYLGNLLLPSDPVLAGALERSAAAGLPAIQVTPSQGRLLNLLVQSVGARSILEVGTLGGYSTIWLARGLAGGGRVVTLEADPKHAEVARQNLADAGLSDIVQVRVGPALETLPTLAEEGLRFDFVFIDADRRNSVEYLRWALRLGHPGTLIVTDNVIRQGRIVEPDGDEDVVGVRRFLESLAAEPAVEATAVQTVGAKGYDGFAVARVKEAA